MGSTGTVVHGGSNAPIRWQPSHLISRSLSNDASWFARRTYKMSFSFNRTRVPLQLVLVQEPETYRVWNLLRLSVARAGVGVAQLELTNARRARMDGC